MALGTQEKRARKEPEQLDGPAPNLKQIWVHEDEGRTTTDKAPTSTPEEEDTISDDGDGLLLMNSNDTLETIRLSTPMAIDKTKLTVNVKQERQRPKTQRF